MKHLTFKKGIHPPYQKEATMHKKIEEMEPGKELVFPMSQHIGSPAKPIVKKGERVLMGQKIGEATSFVSAHIHSSVSGTVKAVEPRMTFRGTKELCVVIEQDEQYELEKTFEHFEPKENLTAKELVEAVKEAGIVGMGGATFPSHVKLSVPEGKHVQYIVVNGAECEPYLTSDHRVMLENGEEVIAGLKQLLKVFKGAKGIIGIENNKMDAIEYLKALSGKEANIEVAILKTKYPQGSEKHLIKATTGKEVPSGKLPIEVGCIVHNIDTIVAIHRCLTKGLPIMRRIVTVSGSGVKSPCNLEVKIGTSYRELLEKAGWDEAATCKVIAGGPMMGIAISDVDVPVVKGTSAILCFTEKEVQPSVATACIRCGKCIEVCPMRLVPNALHRLAIHGKYEAFAANYGMDCIECGCCAYSCPAKRELVQSFRTAKAMLRANSRKED